MTGETSKKRGVKFEKALNDLELLVEKMEAGDLSLEESLKAFEKGVKLSRDCQHALQQAEQTVKVLVEKEGAYSLALVAGEEDDATDDE